MFQKVLLIKLLLLHYATQLEINTRCHEDAQLMCLVPDIESLDFYSLTWHKLSETKQRLGMIRSIENITTLFKNVIRSPEPRFGENFSLLMPSVTPEDQGTYECDITAKVGGRNRNFVIHLKVDECVSRPETIATTTELPHSKPDQDIPAWCSVVGYMAVALFKIALSLFGIWVIEAVCKRSSRRRRHMR